MKSDAVLINTARGNIIHDEDLVEHLNTHPNFWYGADVYNGEPAGKEATFDNPIAKHPRVYGSHHIGASTKQAESAIGDEATRIIKKFANSGIVDNENCVNRETDTTKLHKVSIRHLDKVGILAHCFAVFAKSNWNV
jgi:D-3-phosphoglycerate dehydrogenase